MPAGLTEEDGATVKFTGKLCGITLQNDIVVSGDMQLGDGTMDLNGYTLTVNGDLIQSGGAMIINTGTLKVNGNYTLSSVTS